MLSSSVFLVRKMNSCLHTFVLISYIVLLESVSSVSTTLSKGNSKNLRSTPLQSFQTRLFLGRYIERFSSTFVSLSCHLNQRKLAVNLQPDMTQSFFFLTVALNRNSCQFNQNRRTSLLSARHISTVKDLSTLDSSCILQDPELTAVLTHDVAQDAETSKTSIQDCSSSFTLLVPNRIAHCCLFLLQNQIKKRFIFIDSN